MIREMVPAMRENNPVKCDSIIIDINININIDNEDESFRGLLSNTPSWIGSFLRDARTGNSPNSSVRMSPLTVALRQKKSAV